VKSPATPGSSLRSGLWFASLALATLLSGNAAAAPFPAIDIDFGGGANLNIAFSGNPGANQMVEYLAPQSPPFSEVDAFSATYTDPGPLGTIVWSGVGLVAPFPPPGVFGDLTSLLYDTASGVLISLFASQPLLPTSLPPEPYRLLVGDAVSNPANLAEIQDFLGQLVASAPRPQQSVPAPGSLALLGLGLILLRRRGR
jgi:MYXO-CTERM domain-containing protein